MGELFHIFSDGSCDLPTELAEEKNITVVPFYVSFDHKSYYKEKLEIGIRDFYQKMVDEPKNFPKSSMPSPQDYMDAFLPYVESGMPVVCICITTKFSGSYQSACNAKEMILEDYPDAKIAVINSMINTVCQGLYVLEAAKLRDAGWDFEKSVERLEEIKKTGRIFFTVGSIDYLAKGGRIGKVAAVATNVLGIRPIITLKEGEIFASGISRGRKNSLLKSRNLLLEHFKNPHINPDDYVIDIGFGYDYEEAVAWRSEIVEMLNDNGYPITESRISLYQIGAAISVHTGPYAMGVAIVQKAL